MLAELYEQGHQRVRALVAGLDDDAMARPVPACPTWVVHDVVAHLVGLTDDILNGRTEGAPGPAWTGAQVERRRGMSADELLAEWDANLAAFAALLDRADVRPPVLDVACHEQDIRGAVDQPGSRDNPIIAVGVGWLVARGNERAATAGLGGLRVVTGAGEEAGPAGALTLAADRFELFRGLLGRRSPAQLEALGFVGAAAPYLEHFTVFPPSAHDIIE